MHNIPPYTEHRWVMAEDFMEPVWSDGPILPARLVDIVADAIEDVTMDKY